MGTIGPMDSTEVLAVAHLRQWAHDRCRRSSSRTTNYNRRGWHDRSNRYADAAIVRVIDFERTLAQLAPLDQTILVYAYAHRMPHDRVAIAAGCSTRTVQYRLKHARQALADALDRKGLL